MTNVFKNYSQTDFQKWGKTGGRPRIHLNRNRLVQVYRLKKRMAKLNELRNLELLKPASERVNWVLNPKTNRIIKLLKFTKDGLDNKNTVNL